MLHMLCRCARSVARPARAARRATARATDELTSAQYLFDLHGYIVVPKVFSDEEVAAGNAAIDERVARDLHERSGKLNLSNAYGVKSRALTGAKGRFDMGGMLGWPAPHRDLFRAMLAHPRLVPYYHMFVGAGYRLDHLPFLIRMEKGSEGHAFHGGAVTPHGAPAWPLGYQCAHGEVRCSLLAVSLCLTDVAPGDGGFCIVPGSHKANFACPPAMLAYEAHEERVVQPSLRRGDVVMFTEAATHGTLPWTADAERRTVIYRFSPAGSAYGRGYLEDPAAELDDLAPEHAAVMQPPYHPRLDRAHVDESGTYAPPPPREDYKKEFDKKVFGKQYF